MLTFANDSNRCWFLAALQAILHVPQIANVLREDSVFEKMLYKKRKNASDFACELASIAKKYWSSFEDEGTHEVSTLLDIFTKINRNFSGRKMYDSSECFIKMIETLETAFVQKPPFSLPETCNKIAWEEYSTKNPSTFMSDIFLGQAQVEHDDGDITFEHFTGIVISESSPSVARGIAEFLNDPSTKTKKSVTKFPLVLPIIFQKTANKSFVNYEISLDFSGIRYELFAVLLHVGGCHWMTLAKSPIGWNLFDDSNMRKIDDINSIIQKDAMLLLYKRISTD
ncbi:ubiquitin carboxyl-terminal hydrolase [Paramecium bursaria Chlorella virus NE-JV-1]|nr:ubiquitin carboxyl-terminal hydrolase [Paramecium bursaria Chlorella virus NE-JV-1]